MQPRNAGHKSHAGEVRRFWATILLVSVTCAPLARADDLASRVVIVANSDDAGSVEIANYYAKQRGIPAANIIALPMPTAETITWREFVLAVWQPLQDELIRRQWIDGIAMQLVDAVGRRKVAFSGHRISYLVVCRGVPLRINQDPALATAPLNGPVSRQLDTNQAAVDSELSLLAYGPYDINGFVKNPLFENQAPADLIEGTVIKVARLDGPSVEDVHGMIDGALEAERTGLIGRTYVDVKGPYPEGNQWMEAIIKQLTAMDFAPEVHRPNGTFPATARFDAPAIYFGWYAPNLNGPFALPGFRFAPGAIAVHIYSFSAATLRSDRSGWCGPLIARGAAATTGAVFEPYLSFMHHLDDLLAALARGETLGDAAYYALPVLSWQNVLIGDPLYRPFKRDLADQWAHREQLPGTLAGYVALRELQVLQREGKTAEAEQLARREQRERPSLAVGVALGEILEAKGDRRAAAQALGFAEHLREVPPNQWALLQTAAVLLAHTGDSTSAIRVYENLLAMKDLPDTLRLDWMRQAAKTAAAAGDLQRSINWENAAAREAGKVPKKGGP